MIQNPIGQNLYFVTTSENKYEEYRFLMGKFVNIEWHRFNVEDVITRDHEHLLRRKIQAIRSSMPFSAFLVEQSDLQLAAWENLPVNFWSVISTGLGMHSLKNFLASFDNRSAVAVTKLAFHSKDGIVHIFTARQPGIIAPEPRGFQIFGWDTIFIPDGQDRTLAEMAGDQRTSISTRTQAVAKFYSAVFQEEDVDFRLQNRIRLRQLIVRYFTKSELETLCFDLGIDGDDLFYETKTELAQEIILYCERHIMLKSLIILCRQQRPHAEWPEEF